MKALHMILLASFGCLLMSAAAGLPPRGDLHAPAQLPVNPAGTPVAGAYYIQHAYKHAGTPNIVTVVLADYRGFDTLGETLVVFTGAISVLFILRRRRP
ncbi:MAG: hydrogen gas-evolving membrane-bound hydrogenase subunit E [Thermodesulfobacteriota bacterium]